MSAFTPLVSLLITVISSLGRSDEFLKATIFNSIASIMNYPFIFIGIEYFLVSLIFSNFIKIIINIFYLKKELDVTFSFFIGKPPFNYYYLF